MLVYWLNTMALFRCPSFSARISLRPVMSASTFVLLVYWLRSMRDKMDLEGSSSFLIWSAFLAASLDLGTADRSEGWKSMVSGTRQTGQVTYQV